jgi:pyruvate dehydrogenase (quinone)/pyruvate oxidase
MGPAHVENVVDLACRTALAYRGVSHVTIPVDFQDKEVERKNFSKRNLPHHHYATHTLSSERAQDLDLQKAAEILNAGKKVFILVGQGAHDAREEVSQIAELLEAPVAKALLGKTVIPDDHPYSVGGVGLLGTLPAETAIEECDTLLMVGTSFPYIEFYPKIGQARCVQIDINPIRLNLRYPAEATLVGDSAQVLNQLLPLLKKKSDRGFIESAQAGMKKWRERLHVEATRDSLPMKPQVVASVLGKMIDDNAVVSCDSGTNTTWWARHVPAKAGQLHSVSGTLASMACALPYAIAAAVAYPDRQSICFVGDGGFSMLMAELSTIVKYKLNVKIVVIKNNTLGQIKWEQMVFLGNPEYQCELENIDYAGVATACGVKGFTLDHPKDAERIVREALSHPGPALIDAVVDPLEAPMPAKITVEQALKFSEAVLRGQPQGLKIMKTLGLDRLKEVI